MSEQTPDPLADVLAAHRPCPCGCGWCHASECHELRGTGVTWAAHVAAVVRASGATLDGIGREQVARVLHDSPTPDRPLTPDTCSVCAEALRMADAVLALRPDPAPDDLRAEVERDALWSALDWCLWGVGMGDTFREPLADAMVAALTPEQHTQALAIMADWRDRRGGPIGLDTYEVLRAERDAARAELAALRAGIAAILRASDDDVLGRTIRDDLRDLLDRP